mgnify:CR=1 FL=1
MKTFEKTCCQGDVMFVRVESIPKDAVLHPRETDGSVIVAHSETQHHHAFSKDSGVTLYTTPDPMTCYLRCEEPSALLEHLRPHDTHESISFARGNYMVRRQREWTPEGWAMIRD